MHGLMRRLRVAEIVALALLYWTHFLCVLAVNSGLDIDNKEQFESNMRILFITDLHGYIWKYDRLLEAAQEFEADVIINGGDMLPKTENLLAQDQFITDYLDNHFEKFNDARIYYLCCLGNDDLRIFDSLFEETCNKYPYLINLAQRKFEIGEYEFVGMNWVVDYPFRLKDRCRMDTQDYKFQEQFGTGLLSTQHGLEEIEDWFAYAKTLPTIEDELEVSK
jgi:predicted MPP superfamily phosphohydrolase